tara:strand:- start:225 stop:974 length:750 start_codon:yes stop_codon:yes gene_type:complete
MKVYKERHLAYSFNIDSKYVFKKGPQRGKVYNGPIIKFRGQWFAGEKMTAEVEKKWQLVEAPPRTPNTSQRKEVLDRHIIYDKLKVKYGKRFKFPKSYTHALTEKEIKEGEYTRYFAKFKGEITEIKKADHKYYKKNSTAYHQGVEIAEIKMKLDVMAVDINQAAINEVANRDDWGDILTILSAHDYMDVQEFLYTAGGQLEYEDGVEYVGQYHIHPESGPMEGPTHSSYKHAQLYWSENQTYRPKDLV